jgi:hypothetical protein
VCSATSKMRTPSRTAVIWFLPVRSRRDPRTLW